MRHASEAPSTLGPSARSVPLSWSPASAVPSSSPVGYIGPKPKPRRSRAGWPRSSGRPSDWNSTAPRPSSRTPAASGDGSSAMTSASGTATPKSPAAAGRPTGKSCCACRRTWSRPSAPATGNMANRGTGPGSRTSTNDIVRKYGAEYAGVVNYYLLAYDVWRLTPPAMERPDLHAQNAERQARQHGLQDGGQAQGQSRTRDGLRTCFEARKHREGKPDLVARFGGITLRQKPAGGHPRPRARPGTLPPQGGVPVMHDEFRSCPGISRSSRLRAC